MKGLKSCTKLRVSSQRTMVRQKKLRPEQVANLLRQIEVALANGKTTGLACKEAQTTV